MKSQKKESLFYRCTITCKVIPQATHERWVWDDSLLLWKVYIHESPDKGKANKALCRLCAKILNISYSSIVIIQGMTTTRKVLSIVSKYNQEEIQAQLSNTFKNDRINKV